MNDSDAVTSSILPLTWMAQARRCESPNQVPRPEGEAPSLLVIHNISLPPGEYGNSYIDQLFTNTLDCSLHPYFERLESLRVSSHLLIRRDGELVQYVPLDQAAWHAGESSFEGRSVCNEFSIGIELEGTDHEPFSDAQYARLVGVTREIMMAWPLITRERITGHSDIAPGRKTDPGPFFDWKRYLQQL